MKSGTRVGRFRVLSKIGEGGIGAVYRAVDTHLEREVALKLLQPRLCADPAARARFRREATIAASINHPRLCAVHDFDDGGDRPYLVMELLDGRTLSDRLRDGYLPSEAVVGNAVQLAEALAAVHRRGVVHRDVKPANIMVCDASGVRLFDFGVAKYRDALDSETRAPTTRLAGASQGGAATAATGDQVVGTLGYMSPEQTLGTALDERSDLFSFGVVLYEMAAGVRPFDAPSTAAIIDQVLHDDPPSPRCLNPALPDRLTGVVRRLLHKSPERRYASAAELLVDLRQLETAARVASPAAAWTPRAVLGNALPLPA